MKPSKAHYAVIFRARPAMLDNEYQQMAARLRKLALEEHGCLEFTSANSDGQEIAISYWSSEADIKRWKQDTEHRVAQALGRERWYRSYSVEIARITRRYGKGIKNE